MSKISLAGIALAALLTGPALAADIPVKAPVYKAPPPVPFSWTGCYVGANVGWMRNDSRLSARPTGRYFDVLSATAIAAVGVQNYDVHDSAATAGGQVGCNRQISNWVWGAEADLNWSGVGDTVSASYPLIPGALIPRTQTISHRLDWFSTVRGRLGYSVDRLLVYATAGLAVGEVKSAYYQLFLNGPSSSGSDSPTRVGWTAGGGFEYAFAGNWSAKVEYLYVDLGSFT
jgi:outer membrane immunogenic protein